MRLLLLVLLVLVAGCMDHAAPSQTQTDAPVASEPAAMHLQNQTLAAANVHAMAKQDATFSIRIPQNATNLIVTPTFVEAAMKDGLEVNIPGCGDARFNGLTAAAEGSLGPLLACDAAAAGDATVTVLTDGDFLGTVTITATVPA